MGRIQGKYLGDARPMDNMKYSLDLSMEDVFALNLISAHSIIHLLAFPNNYKHYLKESFMAELSETAQKEWGKSTMYVMKKISLQKKENRKDNNANALDKAMKVLVNLPGCLGAAGYLLRFMDKHGLLPKSLIHASPFHSSLLISNKEHTIRGSNG